MKKLPELANNWLVDENIRESALRDCQPVQFQGQTSFSNFVYQCQDHLMQVETVSILIDELYVSQKGLYN